MRRVVIPEPRRVLLEDVPEPEREGDQALLRVRYVGICGSDVHTYRGSNLLAKYPVVPGHELCWEVIESGEGFSPGETVVVEPLLPCGHCYPCRIGRYNCCENLKVLGVHVDGGMAEEIVLPGRLLYRLAPGADPSCAPLVETLSIGYHACDRGRVRQGDDVLVIGAGPVGSCAALVAKERGARVAALDTVESRLGILREMGIDFCLRAEGDVEKEVVRLFGSNPTVVIEAAGSPETLELGLQVLSAAGRMVFLGWTAESPRWRPDHFLRRELELVASRNSAGIFPQVVEFYGKNQDKVRRLVTHRFKMDRIEEAMRLADTSGSDTMKVIMEW
ncbi:MAG: alcohol dehydrogenase catalytic domain-containing protein [Deltaproteobacteria bacterium]|nr:alcohol dehydrogenase catalytic domain-containing protein [Deltaproteobacteria bacterium]